MLLSNLGFLNTQNQDPRLSQQIPKGLGVKFIKRGVYYNAACPFAALQ